MKLQELADGCAFCREKLIGVGASGVTFYKIEIEQHLVDFDAVRRRAGMELIFGEGGARVAAAIDGIEEFSQSLDHDVILLCQSCALDQKATVMRLLSVIQERNEAEAPIESRAKESGAEERR